VRVIIRLLSYLVIASAAVVAWTRGTLVYVFGAQQTTVFLWIAAGGTVCAIVALARTRKRAADMLRHRAAGVRRGPSSTRAGASIRS
jgi:hypothetical protein